MRFAALLLAVAGCNFEHGLLGQIPVDAEADATPDVAVDAPPDARVIPFCDTQDPDLVACYEFEGSTNDASGHSLNASMTNVTFVTGRVGNAMQFGSTSAADVADSTFFDVSALTVEAWIHPTQLPATGARMGIVDMNNQWGFFLHETGQLKCVASLSAQVAANVPANQWTHVACTYDGSTLTIYANGLAVTGTPMTGGGALSTAGTTGISIAADNPPGNGSRLIGEIDQVRIMARARTAAEICEDAGCATTAAVR